MKGLNAGPAPGADRITGRQAGAMALTAAGLPIFRLCCRVSWPWVLLGSLAAAGTLSALTAFLNKQRAHREGACPRSGTSLPIARAKAFPTFPTKAFPLRTELSGGQRDFIPSCAAMPRKWVPQPRFPSAHTGADEVASDQRTGCRIAPALVPFLLIASLLAAWESGFAFPETAKNPLAAALVLVLAAAAARLGPAVPARCAGILLWVTGALYGSVLVFSLPQLRPERLVPAGGPADALKVFAALLLPGTALCLKPCLEKKRRMPCWPWWCSGVLALAASLVTGGILSPPLAREAEAFRTLARGVSVLGVIRRFEALVNGAQLMSGFCLCSLFLTALRVLMGDRKDRKKYFEKREKSVDK